jgi:hypothetical protein
MRELPIKAKRQFREGYVSGLAAQTFNVMHDQLDFPAYLAGYLVLPPRAIKDPECVGRSAQIFVVSCCQDHALEVAFADPREDDGGFNLDTADRFLLKTDMTFRIPPGNCYRLQNHSRTTEAKLTWTIVKQNAPEAIVQGEGGTGGSDRSDDEEGSGSDTNEVKVEGCCEQEEEGGGDQEKEGSNELDEVGGGWFDDEGVDNEEQEEGDEDESDGPVASAKSSSLPDKRTLKDQQLREKGALKVLKSMNETQGAKILELESAKQALESRLQALQLELAALRTEV